MRACAVLLLVLGCSTEAPPPNPAPAVTAPAGHDHAAHGHAASHGGQQQELAGLHVEALAMVEGVMIWVTDAENKPIPPSALSGSAVVKGPQGVESPTLVPMADHLYAAARLTQGQPAQMVLTLVRDGSAQSLTFDFAAVGLAAHDHTPLHGGVVSMVADLHIEHRAVDGEHRFWVSDAYRQPVKTVTGGTIVDGGQSLPLTLDPSGQAWTAKVDGAGTRPVTLTVRVADKDLTLDFAAAP